MQGHIKNEIGTYGPSEVIFNISLAKAPEMENFLHERSGALIGDNQPYRFEYADAVNVIEAQFGADTLDRIKGEKAMTAAVGALLVTVLVTAYLVDSSYNPFLYFRF